MKYRFFDKYDNFVCTADKCPDTCCSGWLIEIDPESLKRYQNAKGPEKELFKENINFSEGVFKQCPNGDCSFLRDDHLCTMQKTLGEEALCITCDMYPRHVEEFPGVREHSLSLSCPEVSKEFLNCTDKLIWYDEEDEEFEEDYDDFNRPLYDKLLVWREEIISILEDRSISFDERATKTMDYVRSCQQSIDGAEAVYDEMDSQSYFDAFYELETLRPDFVDWVSNANDVLRQKPSKNATSDDIENSVIAKVRNYEKVSTDLDIKLERIAIYFIYTYFCGSVYDDYIYAMANEAIYSAYFIKLLWTANSLLPKDQQLDESVILYKYSRELENSVENLIMMEDILDGYIINPL